MKTASEVNDSTPDGTPVIVEIKNCGGSYVGKLMKLSGRGNGKTRSVRFAICDDICNYDDMKLF